ncbi:Hypothetical predicted protein [Mytilus galloprovincialis]|uniref:Uncharacterized protein n=1 Tax=Mytilus galloprovincialis TaxID=29158 RepID=A0A8B6C1Z1_MYTGA|nr:Hypothetical predicted protein [Mytilus galloprovincialis]
MHVWTSAFIIFMDIMLEKWPNKGQEFLKYMYTVRLASSRGDGSGWAIYDEQYRIRKARCPHSSWAEIDMELWVLYVSTPRRSVHSDRDTNHSVGDKKRDSNLKQVVPMEMMEDPVRILCIPGATIKIKDDLC